MDVVFIQASNLDKDFEVLEAALKLAKCVAFYVDADVVKGRSADLELCQLTQLAGERARVEFERHVEVVDGKEAIKAITVYYGKKMAYSGF